MTATRSSVTGQTRTSRLSGSGLSRAVAGFVALVLMAATLGVAPPVTDAAVPALAWQEATAPTVSPEPTRGVFDSAIAVTLTADPATATIHYTIDGSVPTAASPRYTAPISLASTTTLRAIAVDGALTSEPETHTYAFVDTVLDHSKVRGYASSFPETNVEVTSALTGLPSVFLRYPSEPDSTVEVPVSVEYYDPATGVSVQQDASHRIFGNDSRRLPKNNYRIYFRAETGGNLKAPIFDGYEEGFTPSTSFDKIDLRSSHETFALGYQVGTYLSTRWFNWSLLNMGTLNPHGRHVHVYRNGEYWGVYLLRETFDDNMLHAYYGKDETYFFIADARNITLDGDTAYWDELVADSTLAYPDYKAKWGVPDALFDLSITFGSQYTWRGAGGRDFGMTYMLTDLDYLGRTPTGSMINYGVQGGALKRWRSQRDAEFLRDFSDRAQCFYAPGGSLHPETSSAKWAELVDQFKPGMFAEFARWGSTSFSHQGWQDLMDDIVANWSADGLANRLTITRQGGEYPKVDPVEVSVSAGAAGRTITLQSDSSGDIYYTLDGTDPQVDGQVAAGAVRYTAPFAAPAGDFEIRARLHAPNQSAALDKWSASCPRRILDTEAGSGLIINEINYHPADDAKDTEFVELHNTGDQVVRLVGLRLQAGVRSLTFDSDGAVEPGEFAIIAEDPVAFTAHYGFAPDAAYLGSLSNGGETVSLVGEHGQILDSVAYDDAEGWPEATDGHGSTLERRSSAATDSSEPATWAVSEPGGSPGQANDAPPFVAGDVECDADVDAEDVRAVLRYRIDTAARPNSCGAPVAGASTIDLATCDVAADRACSLPDALVLARCLVGADPARCAADPGR